MKPTPEIEAKVKALWEASFSVKQISARLQISVPRVNHFVFGKEKRAKARGPASRRLFQASIPHAPSLPQGLPGSQIPPPSRARLMAGR